MRMIETCQCISGYKVVVEQDKPLHELKHQKPNDRGFQQSYIIMVSPFCCLLKLNVIYKSYLITGCSGKNQ
jgi:hypothetical protein